MKENPNWKFYKAIFDNEYFELQGENIWGCKWKSEYEIVIVKDPNYGVLKKFHKYYIEKNDKRIEFVAGEFSNCIWGIYLNLEQIDKLKH